MYKANMRSDSRVFDILIQLKYSPHISSFDDFPFFVLMDSGKWSAIIKHTGRGPPSVLRLYAQRR